jgi:hypothetical protein
MKPNHPSSDRPLQSEIQARHARPLNELTAMRALESAIDSQATARHQRASRGRPAPVRQDIARQCLVNLGLTPEAARRAPVHDLRLLYIGCELPHRLTLGAAAVVHLAHRHAQARATSEQVLDAARRGARRASDLSPGPSIEALAEAARVAELMPS